jgi:hypothetical protein
MTATIPALGEEFIPADEEQAILRVAELFRQLRERGYHQRRAADRLDRFPARRDAHAKHHGCLRAEFIVENQLPDELRFGTFQEGMHYHAYVRFSNSSENVQSDQLPDAHAMAVKLLGVHGPRTLDLPGSEQHTQDLIMVQHPVFFSRNASEYVSFSEALLTGQDALQAWMQAHPYEGAIMAATAAYVVENPCAMSYYSMVPYKLGPQAMKFSARPAAGQALLAAQEKSDNYLREVLVEQLSHGPVVYEFFVQVQRDPQRFPVEDPTVVWPEDWVSPTQPALTGQPQKVATIYMPAQAFDNDAQQAFGERLSFNPWHTVAALRPLGGINRVRKRVYLEAAAHRRQLNRDRPIEPTGSERF